MDKSTRIATIIKQRQPLAEKIEQVTENLQTLLKVLSQVESYQRQVIGKVDDPQIIGQIKEIDSSEIQLNIVSEIEALTKLKNRFSRSTLNIGVAGRAKQGKSRFLQSLTGLSTTEIPDGNRQHCTGVRSTIHHNPNVDTYAEVWFHTERSFLEEIIAPYYKKLHLGEQPQFLADFANQPLPVLPKTLSDYAQPGAMYEHLKRYHTHFHQYAHLLKESSPRLIKKSQIREYVAQDTVDGQRILFNYLAVKEVKITCTFPNAEVGKIALVDMPGLGDTGLGDEERLITTLGKDIDFIFFIRMPKSSGDYWADVDVKLYDSASSALQDLPIQLWSFMILNQTSSDSNNGNNSKNCQDLLKTIQEKHINVQRCLSVNCADPVESHQALDAMLEYLINNISALDEKYASACQKRIVEIQKSVESFCHKARAIFSKDSEDDYQDAEELLGDLFEYNDDNWWSKVTLGLQNLRTSLWHQRQVPNENLYQGMIDAIEECEQNRGILSDENAIAKINEKIKIESPFRTYPNYQDELRVLISSRFFSLDKSLEKTIESAKEEAAYVLKEYGGLKSLSEAKGTEFFEAIAQLIPESYKQIKLGFKIIAEFKLSYRGLILPRVRQYLDGLTNISAMTGEYHSMIETTDQTLLISKDTTAEEIFTALEIDYDKAIHTIKPALEELLSEPSEAAYAMVEEFVDNVIRQKDSKKEWKNFLRKCRGQIWSHEFGKNEQDRLLKTEWRNLINQVETANQNQQLRFIEL